MRNMFLLIKNNLKLLFRKKSNVFFIVLSVIVPLVFLFFSYTGNSQLRIGIVNNDNGILSKDLIKSLQNTDKYKVIPLKNNEINSSVAKGDVDCALTLPVGYSDSLMDANIPKLQIVSIKGQETTALIQNYLNLYIKNVSDLSKASNGDKEMFNKMYDEYKKSNFTLKTSIVKDKGSVNMAATRSLAFFIMFLMMSTGSISTMMLQEKREKTFNRICMAPIKSRTYVISNFIVNAIITLFQILLIMLLLILLLKMPIDMALLQLFLIMVIFGLTSIGLSMMTTAFSKSTNQSNLITQLIVTTTCMLGGVFWPLELMPKALIRLSNIIPQKWAVDAITKIVDGTNLSHLLINMVILLAFAAAFILIASYKIKISDKTEEFI